MFAWFEGDRRRSSGAVGSVADGPAAYVAALEARFRALDGLSFRQVDQALGVVQGNGAVFRRVYQWRWVGWRWRRVYTGQLRPKLGSIGRRGHW